MSKTIPVVISVSIIVNAPISDSLSEEDAVDPILAAFTDAIGERLRSSVEDLKSEPWFDQDAGVNYHYLLEENAGRCTRCGRWTSDYDAPDYFDLLMVGETIEGNLVCDECAHFADWITSPATPE